MEESTLYCMGFISAAEHESLLTISRILLEIYCLQAGVIGEPLTKSSQNNFSGHKTHSEVKAQFRQTVVFRRSGHSASNHSKAIHRLKPKSYASFTGIKTIYNITK